MSLIYRGADIPTPGVTVVDWHEHGLTWALGQSGTRKRTDALTQIVHHWTGGEGSYKGVHSVLTNRGLSVQLYLAASGTVYQYADLDTVCAHAGSPTNGRSIGIEMQNVGHGAPGKVQRERLPETVHGREAMTSQFTPAQMAAAIALRKALASIVPVNVFADSTVVPLWRRNTHVGDLGHYQISGQKRDPGTHFMSEIAMLD